MSRILLSSILLAFAACAGEPVAQTTSCAQLVECYAARDEARGAPTDYARFDDGGDCWGSEEQAALCDTSCVNGLALVRERYQDLPEECLR